MAIKFGFFNDQGGDRLYNAEDIGRYLHGIITDGVYPDSNTSLQVLADSGMEVSVQAGRAMLRYHYLESDSPLTLTLAAGGSQDRIDAIVARMDLDKRLCEIAVKQGTPAASPVAPTLANTDVKLEIMLAAVYVAKLTENITQDNITDTRHDVALCGWVTGLLDKNTVGVPVPSAKNIAHILTVNADGTGYELLPTDTTLSFDGAVADAAVVGRRLTELANNLGSHKHNASDINDGTLASDRLPVVPISKGGTGATSAAAALTALGAAPAGHTHDLDALGAAPADHKHSASDINSGTLGLARLPVVSIAKGGTGATNAAAARAALGTASITAIYGVAVTFAEGKYTYTHSAIKANSVVIVQRRSGIAGAATTGMFATTSYDGSVLIVADNTDLTAANLNIIIINP